MILRHPGNISPARQIHALNQDKDIKLKTDLSSIINILKDNYSKPSIGMNKFLSPISVGQSEHAKAPKKLANIPLNMSFDNAALIPKIGTHLNMKTSQRSMLGASFRNLADKTSFSKNLIGTPQG
jgi:hypothetical protein